MRTAIIGIGNIGKVHLEICKSQATHVVALCDTDEEKARDMAKKYYPDAKIYTDYKKMLAETVPQIVHICTPHNLHAEMVITALKAGVHVLCEKPLCISENELGEILQAEKASKAQLGVCLQNRYNPSTVAAKHFLADCNIKGAYGCMVWHRDKEYYESAKWRGKWATEGGGVLINQALHTLDLLQYLVGMPSSVSATTSNLTLKDAIEVEDSAMAVFHGETDFSFFATNGGSVDFPTEINIVTDRGSLHITPRTAWLDGKELCDPAMPTSYGKPCYGGGHGMLIRHFHECIEKGIPFPICGAEAAKVMHMIFAMYESRGKEIGVSCI